MGEWWLRSVLLLQTPRAVFVALRRDGAEEFSDRSEPVLAIVLLAGIVFALSSSAAAHLMDDTDYDALLVCVWAFLAGAVSGGFAYLLLGAALHASVRALGSHGSFRRSRHLLAFAAAPIAWSLLLWPVKLALYGERPFRAGGAGLGAGGAVFTGLELLFAAWAAALLVLGVRAVHGWSWGRAAAGAAPPLALATALLLF
jgi:hypothetical protein